MISYSIFPISIVFCTLKNPQNDTKIIILPLLVKKLWNGLKRMAAILFLCKWGQKVLVGHASMSEMICMTINYNHAKLNNSTPICRVLSLTRPTNFQCFSDTSNSSMEPQILLHIRGRFTIINVNLFAISIKCQLLQCLSIHFVALYQSSMSGLCFTALGCFPKEFLWLLIHGSAVGLYD